MEGIKTNILINNRINNLATKAISGVEIEFGNHQIYNSYQFPGTGNFTENLGNAKLGIVQRIYHFANTYQSETAPTFPANWVLLGSNQYNLGSVNIIEAQWCGGTRVEYSFIDVPVVTATFGWVDDWLDGMHQIGLWTSNQGNEENPIYYEPFAGFPAWELGTSFSIEDAVGTTVYIKITTDNYPSELNTTYTDSAGAVQTWSPTSAGTHTLTYMI